MLIKLRFTYLDCPSLDFVLASRKKITKLKCFVASSNNLAQSTITIQLLLDQKFVAYIKLPRSIVHFAKVLLLLSCHRNQFILDKSTERNQHSRWVVLIQPLLDLNKPTKTNGHISITAIMAYSYC